MTTLSPAKLLEKDGAVVFSEKEVPLNDDEWLLLEKLVSEVKYEHIVGGDTGDKHSVWVSRFINDVEYPKNLQQRSDEIKNIFMSNKMKKFYASFTGEEKLCLRRCQANLLSSGDYVGEHIDRDTSPDYFASVVFYLKSDYQGGDFVSIKSSQNKKSFHPPGHSVLVNRGDVLHHVEPVTEGKRQTIACFLSKNFGRSMKPRQDFNITNNASKQIK